MLIFTYSYRSHFSIVRLWNVLDIFEVNQQTYIITSSSSFFLCSYKLLLILNSWTNYIISWFFFLLTSFYRECFKCVRFFVALMLLFMPEWWKILINKQMTKDLFFAVSELLYTYYFYLLVLLLTLNKKIFNLSRAKYYFQLLYLKV